MNQNESNLGLRFGMGISVLALVLGWCSLFWWDERLLVWLSTKTLTGDFAKAINLLELFGHGTGIAVLGLAILLLDRCNAARFLWATVVPSIAVAGIKLFFLRRRPSQLSGEDHDTSVAFQWPSFGSPDSEHGLIHDAMHSFPSGHAVTAFAIATTLTSIYPQGRWLFFGIASLAGLQRLVAGSHYASDVIFGAVFGWLMATAILCVLGGSRSEP